MHILASINLTLTESLNLKSTKAFENSIQMIMGTNNLQVSLAFNLGFEFILVTSTECDSTCPSKAYNPPKPDGTMRYGGGSYGGDIDGVWTGFIGIDYIERFCFTSSLNV